MGKSYGFELVIDLHLCDKHKFNRKSLEDYFKQLCTMIEMERCELYFWDDLDVIEEECQTLPHTKGTSAVQFILTSNITIHTLDLLGDVFVNIFSCKEFHHEKALDFTIQWFEAQQHTSTFIKRGNWDVPV